MNYTEFINKIKNEDDIPIIKKAYDFASTNLAGQMRKNGETVLSHCLNVASILNDLNVDNTTIVSAIIHETLDQDEKMSDEIKKEFGMEIFNIVENVSKINHLEMLDDSEDSAIYLRKVMVGLSEDVRVLFIKLADRLHNMKTLENFSREYQKKISNETLHVLIPIAHRLGINSIKSELENLCLYYLKPEVYNDILERLNDSVNKLNDLLEKMKVSLSEILTNNEIKFEIKGRVKSVYSIYNKLNSGKAWEDIYDILALRIFVEKESECYAALGLIHAKYRPVANRFKDYIAMPKENMYQSLHTTIIGEGGKNYEVQIRTYEMDEIAEKGIASHWSYKEKGTKKIQTMMEQKLELYRSIIESSVDDNDFNNLASNELLSDLMYVYTPKGDVVEMPIGSTPIDFAYRIHSKVGDTMVGAIVNDEIFPINKSLKENDVVKIMTSATGKPNKDWLNYVKTSQAKNKIKAYFSKIAKNEYILRGKSILEKEIRRKKLSINEILSTENIDKICKYLKLKDLDDLYLGIGSFRYTAGYVINFLTGTNDDIEDVLVAKPIERKNINNKIDILVDGKTSILTHLAKCCYPVKGDEIIGVITRSDGIAVHRCNCPNVTDKTVEVSWNQNADSLYTSKIRVTSSIDKDYLSDILSVLTSLNIQSHKIEKIDDNSYILSLRFKDTESIDKLINSMQRLRYVKEVERL